MPKRLSPVTSSTVKESLTAEKMPSRDSAIRLLEGAARYLESRPSSADGQAHSTNCREVAEAIRTGFKDCTIEQCRIRAAADELRRLGVR